MKNKVYEIQGTNYKAILGWLFLLAALSFLHVTTVASAAQWSGVDESVVEKYAGEHGRTSRAPLINTDQGDLLLFLFLLAGAVGGFAAGYYWRQLTEGVRNRKGGSQAGQGHNTR